MGEWLQVKDVFYIIAGIAFFGLTILPLLSGLKLVSVPTLYVAVGALLAVSPLNLPVVDPLNSELSRLVIEHFTELIVIIALAGAGLAIDRAPGKLEWHHTWALLSIAMPLTIIFTCALGYYWLGLPLASAMLLAASLAPTDPVLARSVQVSAPTEGEEDDVRVSLTTEAGLNDSLAFPFVYLALAFALNWGAAETAADGWLLDWFTFDVLYRVAVGLIVGWITGYLFVRLVFSRYGDASQGGENAGLVMLSATFVMYGVTEALEGYGFLAVFVGAVTARSRTRGQKNDQYVTKPYQFSDQFEKILLAVLLLWLGFYAASGILADWRWQEVAVAVLLIAVIRPIVGYLALLPTKGTVLERGAIAGFGIRGLGTFFYLAYAQGHGTFESMDAVWRISIITVLLSIFIHGMLAPIAMNHLQRLRTSRKSEVDT